MIDVRWFRNRAANQYDWRPAFDLMLEESRRSVDRQMLSVREARQRAGNLLGYASIVAAALGFSARDGELTATGWAAIGGFLIVGLAVVYVLYPRRFRQDLQTAEIDAWFDHPDNTGVDHMVRSAALAHDANYAYNRSRVTKLHRGITVAVVGLVIETAALATKLVL
ncbi:MULTISPECIES: hypothetical protein [unclassified Aeromicrobium]|uniref:hypothetical protein n=1 Tax=unclassified Aeromicrobium TaxID=2633570 RepID=UPI00396B330D